MSLTTVSSIAWSVRIGITGFSRIVS